MDSTSDIPTYCGVKQRFPIRGSWTIFTCATGWRPDDEQYDDDNNNAFVKNGFRTWIEYRLSVLNNRLVTPLAVKAILLFSFNSLFDREVGFLDYCRGKKKKKKKKMGFYNKSTNVNMDVNNVTMIENRTEIKQITVNRRIVNSNRNKIVYFFLFNNIFFYHTVFY